MRQRKKYKAGGRNPKAPTRRGIGRLRTPLALAAVAFLAAALVGGLLFYNLLSDGGPKTAAIVDQLSLTAPNPDFAEAATATLKQVGYEVDYYPGEEVTVNFYRNLPAGDYHLIILRVHSGITTLVNAITGEKTKTQYVSLFTGEPYSEDKYAKEQLNGLAKVLPYEGAGPLFSIAPLFVQEIMRGKFDDTTVILMGCDGLRSRETAKAFLQKGARAFVSWSGPVSPGHTDAATERLLEKLLLEGLPVRDAVAQTAAEVGPDPSYGAELRVLPDER